jgi:HlyD family secretion protein
VTVLVAATRKTGSVTTTSSTFTARRDNLTITVTEGGSIRAHNSIQYKCQVERRGADVTILNIVPGGTYITQEDVDKNKVLVELDSSALKDRLTQEKMSLASNQESVISAEEALHIQELQNESDIADAELKKTFALMDFQKYLGETVANTFVKDVNSSTNINKIDMASLLKDPNSLGGAASQDLKRLTDSITLADSKLERADDTLGWTKKLYDKKYVSSNELQADQLDYDSLKIQKEQAVISLDLFKLYDFPKQVEQLLSNYIEAGRQLQRTYAECRSRLAQAQVKLSMAKSRFDDQAEQVKELEQQIEYCVIKAKAPGLVVYGTGGESDIFRAMRGGRGMSSGMIAEGEIVTEGQVIISMPDTASMVAEIGVHETEVDKVRRGQPATIVMDAFPDKVLQGEVLEVAPLPDEQRGWMNPDLKVYKTLVKIDGTHDFLRSRMSCKVQILVNRLEDVIIVPIQVVSNRSGKKVCFVMTPQGPQERVVQTGAFNDTFVQVTEGLQEGEEVMLNPPLFSESTGAVGFQQQQPLPEKKLEQVQTGEQGVQEQSGDRAGRADRSGGRQGIPQGIEVTDEMRQKMEQFKRQGGQGMPEMTEEMKQKMMEQFKRMGSGQGMPEMTDEMRQKLREQFGGGQQGGRSQGGGRRNRQGGSGQAGQAGQDGAGGTGQTGQAGETKEN